MRQQQVSFINKEHQLNLYFMDLPLTVNASPFLCRVLSKRRFQSKDICPNSVIVFQAIFKSSVAFPPPPF